MAIIRKKSVTPVTLTLSTELSVPCDKLSDYTIWLYGSPGIGKTSLASMFPSAHFFMFEPGAKALAVMQRPVTDWVEWKKYIELFKHSKFLTAVVDTTEIAYKLSFADTCRVLDIEHPADENDMGKSWSRIEDGFFKPMRELQTITGKSCIFISHAQSGKRKTADGEEVEDVHPGLTGKPLKQMAAFVDILAYAHVRKGLRCIQIKEDDMVMAKCRPADKRFLLTDGTPIKYIPMGRSKEEAYDYFVRAFNNELTRDDVKAFDIVKKTFVVKKKGT